VSLHVDGDDNPDCHGIATYYYGTLPTPTHRGRRSIIGERLADLVQREVVARTDFLDCRTHAKSWELLRGTRMPAVRIEVGYLTNPGDAARLASALADPGRIATNLAPRVQAPRFAYLRAFPRTVNDAAAEAVIIAVVAQLRTRAEVVPVDIPPMWHDAKSVLRTIMLHEAARNLGELQLRERARMTPAVNAALDEGRAIGPAAYEDARSWRERAIAFFTQWLEGYDAVLAPSAPGPAPRGLDTTGDPSCCTLWSLLGFPAISLPVGLVAQMPIGLQLAAPQDCDDSLLAAAAWCGARLPFHGLV